jgi:hypothetical protein
MKAILPIEQVLEKYWMDDLIIDEFRYPALEVLTIELICVQLLLAKFPR